MKRIIFITILLFAFCIAVSAQKSGQPPSSRENTKAGKAVEINQIFEVLFYGLDLEKKEIKASPVLFSRSNEQDVLTFLKNLPVTYNNIANDFSFEKRYRYIQAYYGKYFIVFQLGNEPNSWKDKLYTVSFNITLRNKEIAEDETNVFKKLKQMYGEYTKTEKFRYSSGSESDLNLYIWELPKINVTYRSFYDAEKRQTAIVVQYWDSQFYKTFPYYEL